MGFNGWAALAGIALLGMAIYQITAGRAITSRRIGHNKSEMNWLYKSENPRGFWINTIGTMAFSFVLLLLAIFVEK